MKLCNMGAVLRTSGEIAASSSRAKREQASHGCDVSVHQLRRGIDQGCTNSNSYLVVGGALPPRMQPPAHKRSNSSSIGGGGRQLAAYARCVQIAPINRRPSQSPQQQHCNVGEVPISGAALARCSGTMRAAAEEKASSTRHHALLLQLLRGHEAQVLRVIDVHDDCPCHDHASSALEKAHMRMTERARGLTRTKRREEEVEGGH